MTLDLNNLDNFCSKKMMRFSRSWSFVLPFHMRELNQKKGLSNVSANTVNSLMGYIPNFKWRGWMDGAKIYIYIYIPGPSSHTQKNPWTKSYHPKSPMSNFRALLIDCNCSWDTRALLGFFRLLWILKKKTPQIKPPKKILAKFSYPPPPPKTKSRNRTFKTPKNPSINPVTWNPEYSPWGQLSPWKHLGVTDTPLIRTAAESQTEINSLSYELEIAYEDTKSRSLQCPL